MVMGGWGIVFKVFLWASTILENWHKGGVFTVCKLHHAALFRLDSWEAACHPRADKIQAGVLSVWLKAPLSAVLWDNVPWVHCPMYRVQEKEVHSKSIV